MRNVDSVLIEDDDANHSVCMSQSVVRCNSCYRIFYICNIYYIITEK